MHPVGLSILTCTCQDTSMNTPPHRPTMYVGTLRRTLLCGFVAWVAVTIVMVAVKGQTAPAPATTAPSREDAEWPIAAKDASNQRFSRLDQITTDNVKSLKVAWTFGTGVN